MFVKNVLIIQTAFLGDVILSTALVEKLAAFYPDVRIDFLCKKGMDVALAGHPHIRTVLTFDKSTHKLKNLIRLICFIRKNKYDIIINTHRFLTSGMMTAFGGAKQTIGFKKNPLSFLYHNRFPYRIGKDKNGNWKHELERNHELIAHLTDSNYSLPKLYPTAIDKKKAAPYLSSEKKHICISPSSLWFTKRWTIDKWTKLIEGFPSHAVYLLGAPSDKALCESIKATANHPYVINLAGLAIAPSAVLMQAAEMNFVNDSAPLHICTAMQAPVRALFCSTTESLGFGPIGKNAQCIEAKIFLPCKPCGFHGHQHCPEKHFHCATLISIEQVMRTL